MNIFQAIILGIVEGLTEFLPVSSTGHLILASDLLNLNPEEHASFNIIIQFGAILAVVFLYWPRFLDLFSVNQFRRWKDTSRLNLVHVFLGIAPVLIVGFLSRNWIKAHLYRPEWVLFFTVTVAIIMILVEKFKPLACIQSLDEIGFKKSFLIGLGQCFALAPGVSRSGSTMLTSMLLKVDIKTAADYSFMLSVPVISAATIYELMKSYQLFSASQIELLVVGLVTSFLVAIVAIKTFLSVLKQWGLTPFAYYRIVFGIIYYLVKLR